MPDKRILVVEDEPLVAQDIRLKLEETGYKVAATCSSGKQAVINALKLVPDLVLMDIVLEGDVDGIEAAHQIHEKLTIPVVYLTTYTDEASIEQAKVTDPFGYIVKPTTARELHAVISLALYRAETTRKLRVAYWTSAALISICDAFITLDAKGLITSLNPAAEALLHTDEHSAKGHPIDRVARLPARSDGVTLENLIAAVMSDNIPFSCKKNTEFILNDGTTIPIRFSVSAVTDPAGNNLGAALVAHDDSERRAAEQALLESKKTLEARVIDRTQRLSASNDELETFCYSVSHDLRSPLRSIGGFSSILLESHAAQLDEEGQDYLKRICNSVKHMNDLIGDLLALSGATKAPMHPIDINVSNMAQEILRSLQADDSERKVDIKITPDLHVKADPGLLRIVLNNLLGNAWKFTRNQTLAHIEVGECSEQGHQVCYVRDDGVGFDMAHARHLFGAFQRFHNASEFEGSGIGLATVKRIIMRHGGRVRAESAPGKGTTMYISLPDARQTALSLPIN